MHRNLTTSLPIFDTYRHSKPAMQQYNPNRFGSALIATLSLALIISAGCATNGPWASKSNEINFAALDRSLSGRVAITLSEQQRLDLLSGDVELNQSAPRQNAIQQRLAVRSKPTTNTPSAETSPKNSSQLRLVSYGTKSDETKSKENGQRPSANPSLIGPSPSSSVTVRAQSSDDFGSGSVVQAGGVVDDGSFVQQTAYQHPELSIEGRTVPAIGLPSPNIGSPNEANPLIQPLAPGGNAFPANYADLDIYVAETQTGKINFGGAYNSDNGIVGQFVIDEKNFDISRWPRSFKEIMDGTAWRGAGQSFRLELAPGANLQRYAVTFTEPHFRGTDYSFSASGYLFERQYFDWDEERLGGRFSLGRRLTPDLSISAGVRLESVTIDNPRLGTSTELNNSLGASNLFLGHVGLVRDTRDSRVQATSGSYLSMTYNQAFGDFSYARGDVDYRRYRLLYERPDGSGRHTLSYGTKAGFSGSSTPIFENYFAGGFSTLRGYDFRGAAPIEGGVRVGGEFQWLNSVEYMFPVTADDMVKGVLFCDFGTVEESITINADNFRVAPGFGFRVQMPGGATGGAPLAFDFAFPVSSAPGDEEKIFSFYLGVLR